MKKLYTKPQIAFEDFKLSTSIAGCRITDPNDSRLIYTGLQVFVGTDCEIDVNQVADEDGRDDTYNGVCYDVPVEGFNFFQS